MADDTSQEPLLHPRHSLRSNLEFSLRSQDSSVSSLLLIRVDLENDHFHVEHKMRNPFVMILGITTYKGKKSNGWNHLPGVDQDVEHMKQLWQGILKFDTRILTDSYHKKYADCSRQNILEFRDECRKEIENTYKASAMANNKKRYDGLICIVSGHGIMNNLIAGDGKEIDINVNFFISFNADLLAALANYPKIFLFDTCRGGEPAYIIEKYLNLKGSELISCNVKDGYRISYATTPRNTALDNPEKGGCFLKAFYDVMTHLYNKQILHKTHLQTILQMTSQKARIRSNDWLCPVHEDYTNYKIFIQCIYSQDNGKNGKNGITLLDRYSLKDFVKIKELQELEKKEADKDEEKTFSVRSL